MKLIISAVLLLLFASQGFAQNRSDIHGKVVDSLTSEPMEFATTAVLDMKDSSLVSYTLTIKSGVFTLHNLPAQKQLKLVVSFVGYKNYRKTFNLDKGAAVDMGTIKLSSKGYMKELNINAEASPVIFKKDTIEFSAEAFKTPPNAVVEELLRRLPGIQVDIDGTITFNGKKISKLLIGGKEFFVNDPKIATRNLDASLIDKVQVYDDRENDPDHLIPDSKVNKIIDLKLKSAIKKSTFGKLRAGAGTQDRFDGGLLYNTFRDTLQISLIGIGNNLNKTGFSSQELSSQGGFNRSGTDAINNGSLATGGRSYGGIQTVGSGGLNINTDYGKKLKLNLLYFYSFSANTYRQTQFTQQFLGNDTLSSKYSSERNSSGRKHSISGLVEWKPDTATKIRYTPRIVFTSSLSDNNSFSNTFNNLSPQLNSNIDKGNSHGNTFQFQQTFNYYRKLKKDGPSINITHSLNISPETSMEYSDQYLTSYTAQVPSTTFHRLEDNTDHSIDASLNINYRYPLTKKLTGNLSLNNDYDRGNTRAFTYNENMATEQYDIYIDSLSNNQQRDQFTETIRPEIEYQFTKEIHLTASLGLQLVQTNNRFNKNMADINRRDAFVLPAVQLSVKNMSFNYDESTNQPSIYNLLPQTRVYSPLYTVSGNPGLQPSRTRSLSFYFSTNKPEKQLSFNINSYFSWTNNSVFNERTVSNQGITFSKPVNKDGAYYGYLFFTVTKGFKKFNDWTLRLSSRLSTNQSHDYFQVNNDGGFSNSFRTSFTQTIYANWHNILDINPAYSISPNITTYQHVNYNTVKYITQTLDIPVVLRWPKHMSMETNYSYSYNPLVANGFQKSSNLLNIAIARQIQKRDRGEIRLSCYDLLDQNISSYRYAYANNITDVQTHILKRYFLLSYSYRFSNVVTAAKKKTP
jgi:hypothetical protein